jgi:hypothetical protein
LRLVRPDPFPDIIPEAAIFPNALLYGTVTVLVPEIASSATVHHSNIASFVPIFSYACILNLL